MESEPDDVAVAEDDVHDSREEGEGDTLIFQPPHGEVNRIKSKQSSLAWSISLLLCPYASCALFLVTFAVLAYLCFLPSPTIAVLNTLPATNSVVIDLAAISASLYQNYTRTPGKVSVQESTRYVYDISNYLLSLPPMPQSACSLSFRLCEDGEVESFDLYTVSNGGSQTCEAYLSGNSTMEVNFAPQKYRMNKFLGVNLNKNVCHPQQFSICSYTFIRKEKVPTHPVSTGLHQVYGPLNVSLPHYNCPGTSEGFIPGNSKLLIKSTDKLLSECSVVVSTETGWAVYNSICVHFLISAFFIFSFLMACDLSGWMVKRFFRKKYE